MVGRNQTDAGNVLLRWEHAADADVLVEVRRTNSVRDVREGLVALAYAVSAASRSSTGLCVIADSRLSRARLQAELARFRAIVRPHLASRLYLATARSGDEPNLDGDLPVRSEAFMSALFDAIRRGTSAGDSVRITRQQVKAALVERALWGLPALSLAELRRQTGASYQTADAALRELEKLGAISGQREGPLQLQGLRPQILRKLADEHARVRKSVHFVDPTGNARTPGAMAERLSALQKKRSTDKVALAGVLGASRYCPDLNITGAPRLDLSVFNSDHRFVSKLDAGLLRTDDHSLKPVVVLHVQRDCRPSEVVAEASGLAARLDCLADLEELGLHAEAEQFAHALFGAGIGS